MKLCDFCESAPESHSQKARWALQKLIMLVAFQPCLEIRP
jgi:hypothetical protein